MFRTFAFYSMMVAMLLLASCKEEQELYYIHYQSQGFEVASVRVLHNYNDRAKGLHGLKCYLHTKDITFSVEDEKGQGASLCLELCIDSADVKAGNYVVSTDSVKYSIVPGSRNADGRVMGSYFKQMYNSKIKRDTSIVLVQHGSLTIGEPNADNHNEYVIRLVTSDGDSIAGRFKGAHTYVNNVDGHQVGEVMIGDSLFALQRGEMMLWGDIYEKGVNYYELFFYSTNLRTSEVGKFQKGLVLVLGLSSKGETEPLDGEYPLSRSIKDQTAWTGRKDGNIDWGCYWYNYVTSTIVEKAFINRNGITFQKNGNKYDVTFHCLDQLGDTIKGSYSGTFKRIDLR